MAYKFILTYIIILLLHTASSQVNGEFWWLNDKVSKLHSDRVPAPKFEELSGRETDENDKIVFYDRNVEEIPPAPTKSTRKNVKDSKTWSIHFPDWTSNFLWSSGLKHNQIVNETKYTVKGKNRTNKKKIEGDVLTLNFSNEVVNLWEPLNSSGTTTTKTEIITHATPKKTEKSLEEDKTKTLENKGIKINSVESICSFIKAEDCHLRGGNIYNYRRRRDQKSDGVIYPSLTCCVLPLPSKNTEKIVFEESNEKSVPNSQPRRRRSTNSRELDKVLMQRKALMKKNKTSQKIVSPSDDYEDVYANIRVHGSKKLGRPAYSTNYDSVESDSADYADEMPRPGLVVYSDREPAWYDSSDTTAGEDSVIVDADAGYHSPALDPRVDVRVATVNDKSRRGKPNTLPSVTRLDANSQTITYHSTPDFKVLQNFKLPNFGKNRIRLQNKDGKKATNNIGIFTETEESRLDDVSSESFLNKQFYNNCDTEEKWSEEYEKGSPGGEAPRGSHPHLALLTRKSSRRALCYATIVHPRAAITAASCVYGSSPGDVTLHSGIRDLYKDRQGQRRIANVQINPRYSPGDLTHDIAILYWSRPLRLGSNLSPVCVDDPRVGDTCIFLGWGPDAQATSSRPRWQWATVMKSRDCHEPLRGTFCASLEDEFVGGTGGALVCRRGGREGRTAAVGVVVRRGQDAQLTLLPLATATAQLLTSLHIA